jgi:hypothetical protein
VEKIPTRTEVAVQEHLNASRHFAYNASQVYKPLVIEPTVSVIGRRNGAELIELYHAAAVGRIALIRTVAIGSKQTPASPNFKRPLVSLDI